MTAIGLGIDTTFDDTSVAILKGKRKILSNRTLSQYKEHEEFGGVVPERASRKHLEVIHHIISGALKEADLDFSRIDYIAVPLAMGRHELVSCPSPFGYFVFS